MCEFSVSESGDDVYTYTIRQRTQRAQFYLLAPGKVRMKLAAFVAPVLQLVTRNTCRQNHRLISDVRPHVQHTDFAPLEQPLEQCSPQHQQAFRVVLMSSDLRPTHASSLGDMCVVMSPLCIIGVALLALTATPDAV